jgi:cysteine desulfurase family protein (TIGR01976 family)
MIEGIRELDIDWVRQQFPGLESGWAFFDNAGGTLPAVNVIDRVSEYMRRWPVQLGASYAVSQDATEGLERATRAVASLMDAGDGSNIDSSQIIWAASTSELLQRLARSISPQLQPGDEIVVTDTDHEANNSPWRRLAGHGIGVREWRLNQDTLRLEPDELAPLLNSRTRLVCVTQTSNVLGTILPLREVTQMVHSSGARICVDAVAYAPHRLPDVVGSDVDYYTFSLYKVFGPHVAVMYGKRAALAGLSNINHQFFADGDLPWSLMPGAYPYELGYATLGVMDYIEALSAHHGGTEDGAPLDLAYSLIAGHETRLLAPLLDFLHERRGVTVYGERTADAELRLPTASFAVDGVPSSAIPSQLDPHRIGIRWGDFYAPRLIDALGLRERDGVVRVSLAHYNDAAEIERLITKLDEILP